MLDIGDDTIVVGATDLRTEVPRLLGFKKKVIIMKRGKPIGVLQNFDVYKEQEEILDTFEDIILGYLAKERFDSSSDGDYLNSDAMKAKIGI